MTIIEKKMNALKALENHDKKLSSELDDIEKVCQEYIEKHPLNGTKSENAITKQYVKRVEKILVILKPDEQKGGKE